MNLFGHSEFSFVDDYDDWVFDAVSLLDQDLVEARLMLLEKTRDLQSSVASHTLEVRQVS